MHCDLANSYINSGIPFGWNVCARLGVADTHKKKKRTIFMAVCMCEPEHYFVRMYLVAICPSGRCNKLRERSRASEAR